LNQNFEAVFAADFRCVPNPPCDAGVEPSFRAEAFLLPLSSAGNTREGGTALGFRHMGSDPLRWVVRQSVVENAKLPLRHRDPLGHILTCQTN